MFCRGTSSHNNRREISYVFNTLYTIKRVPVRRSFIYDLTLSPDKRRLRHRYWLHNANNLHLEGTGVPPKWYESHPATIT